IRKRLIINQLNSYIYLMKHLFIIFFLLVSSTSIKAQIVYITKTGEKYHQRSCQHLKKSSLTISLEDAKNRGYEPCKVCRPTTVITQKAANTRAAASTQTTSSQNLTNTTQSNTSVQCSAT